jgi:hypothetical protein
MIPYPKDIKVRRGDTKRIFFRVRERVWNPALNGGAGGWEAGPYRDLTGWTVLAQIRETTESAEPTATFTTTLSNQTTTPGGVELKLAPAVTAAMTLPAAGGGWDVQLTDLAGDVHTYIEGKVTFEKDYSRV